MDWIHRLIVCACLLTATGAAALGDSVTLEPARDNMLVESGTGGLSSGHGSAFAAGRTGQFTGSIRRGLIAFDLAGSIPAGSTITGASLTLHVVRAASSTATPVLLHRVSASWGEGASNSDGLGGGIGIIGDTSETNDATWIHRFYPASNWTAAGGDYVSAASASTSVAGVGDYSWASPELAADVQAWLDAPATNYGWIVIGNETTGSTAKAIFTREHAVAAERPRLTITFDPPAGPDCNANGVIDAQDIASNTSQDCDGDGVPDECQPDADGDGRIDPCDGCPGDGAKTSPGSCGCGAADSDRDGDGSPDCVDGCPDDPLKTQPGALGCGVSEADSDGDGVPDSVDRCPGFNDNLDADADGTPDCLDGCPNDPRKTAPGACGCGVADEDTDGDGVPDCIDNCAATPNPDQADADRDGVGDACDGCPDDSSKIAPGACGCHAIDTDTDGDGIADCLDTCPLTPNPDQTDMDGDGIGDACDNCPDRANPEQEDADVDGIGDVCDNCPSTANLDQRDSDGDGVGDICDNCPFTGNPSQQDRDGDGIGDYCDDIRTIGGCGPLALPMLAGGPLLYFCCRFQRRMPLRCRLPATSRR